MDMVGKRMAPQTTRDAEYSVIGAEGYGSVWWSYFRPRHIIERLRSNE